MRFSKGSLFGRLIRPWTIKTVQIITHARFALESTSARIFPLGSSRLIRIGFWDVMVRFCYQEQAFPVKISLHRHRQLQSHIYIIERRRNWKDYDKTQTNVFASVKNLKAIPVAQLHQETNYRTERKLKLTENRTVEQSCKGVRKPVSSRKNNPVDSTIQIGQASALKSVLLGWKFYVPVKIAQNSSDGTRSRWNSE